MFVTPDSLVSYRVPEGWRAELLGWDLVIAPETEWTNSDGKPGFMARSVSFGALVVPEGDTARSVADAWMYSRARPDRRDEFSAQVAARDARVFDWTDGICDILTYVVEFTPRLLVLIHVVLQGRSMGGYDLDIHDVAADALDRIEWKTGVVESVRYEVWRQDDNGNRFLVSDGQTYDEASRTLAQFEALTHKQTYWISVAAPPT